MLSRRSASDGSGSHDLEYSRRRRCGSTIGSVGSYESMTSVVGRFGFAGDMIVVLPSLLLFLSVCVASTVGLGDRTCGNMSVDYPFGFGSDRPIGLNCSLDEQIPMIGPFRVIDITRESIILSVPRSCGRPISAADALFSENYALASTNSLTLGNCSTGASIYCAENYNLTGCNRDIGGIGCNYANGEKEFFLEKFITAGICSDLVLSNSGTREGIAQLDWWLGGGCELCSDDTQCRIRTHPVTQKQAVNCKCDRGLVGDGFVAGKGCHKESRRCKPSDYMRGKCGSKSKVGILFGGIIAGVVLTVGLALLYCFVKKCVGSSKERNETRRLQSQASCAVPVYGYKEIERATDGFSDKNRLGTGAYGTVYVGKLRGNELVAVKRLKNRDGDGIEQAANEINLLSSVSHPNLVRLLGCCVEKDEHVLVYEFMPNGTLAEHLQRERGGVLPWTVRLDIAADTAKAIAHLHFAAHPRIYHRDLLDHSFHSKVADFGLSRMVVTESSHVSTTPQGTPGYVDPEYHQNFHLSDKSDVYSFGVVLVEIITAKKAVDFSRGQTDVNLATMAVAKIGEGRVEEIVDPYLELDRDAWTLSSIHKVAELAFRCLAFHRDMRPSMLEVSEELERIRLRGRAPSTGNLLRSPASSLRTSASSSGDRSRGASKGRVLLWANAGNQEAKGDSPVSVQDPWRSEQSSPSANSLLGSAIR